VSTTTWPAAGSERSAALVHGPQRPATVLAAFPTALYLQVGGHADVLPVVTRGGLRLPTSLAVASTLPTLGWGAQPGDRVVVGDGAVHLPGVVVRAVRTWRPRSAPSATTDQPGRPLAHLPLSWRSPARGLTALLTGDAAPYLLAERVGTLVGAGPGLTPSGDDVLCGVLLGLRLHPRGSAALVADLWRAVQPRLTATTSLSAALLREAADGYAVEPVLRLLERLAVVGSPHAATSSVAETVDDVLAIGHTSGADLLGGLAGCLDALSAPGRRAAPSPRAAPRPLAAPTPLTALAATPRSLP
jgi:hypothetical protein